MRILADENIPGAAVNQLRSRGFDVLWVRTDMPGSDDRTVLARAQREGRLLITFDKDFGELAYRAGLPASSGVVLFRVAMPSARAVAQLLADTLEAREDWEGRFSVIDDEKIRIRPLPGLDETTL